MSSTLPKQARWPHPIHLWKVLAISLSVLILVTVGLVGMLSFRNSQQAIYQLAAKNMDLIGDQIQQHLDEYLENACRINQANANSVKYGDLKLGDLTTLEKRLFAQLKTFEDVSTVFFATPQGMVRGAGRDSGNELIITADYTKTIAFFSYAVDEYGNKRELVNSVPGIDVRHDRPWYTLAVKTGKPGWTPVFQIANFKTLTINAFYPIYDQASRALLGVFSVNIPLQHISQFLQTFQRGSTAALFILDADGYLIGSASDPIPFTVERQQEWQTFRRMQPQDSENPVIRETAAYLHQVLPAWDQNHSEQQLSFRGQNDRYYIQTHPYFWDNNLKWLIVEVVPGRNCAVAVQGNFQEVHPLN